MNERVYGYIRVSGLAQRDGDGPERQKVAIVAFCQQHNLNLINIYEESISGTKDAYDRPAFGQMVTDAETNGVTGIIVERLDRLARELLVQEVVITKLSEEANLHVYATDNGQLEDLADANADPTRVLIRQVLGALAQWNRSEITRKLAAARKRKREATGRCEGAKPYGVKPGEPKVLEVIRANVARGHTVESIANLLNSCGLLTRRGRAWTVSNLYPIVKRNFPEYRPVKRGYRPPTDFGLES